MSTLVRIAFPDGVVWPKGQPLTVGIEIDGRMIYRQVVVPHYDPVDVVIWGVIFEGTRPHSVP